jgi:hypothetical protein
LVASRVAKIAESNRTQQEAEMVLGGKGTLGAFGAKNSPNVLLIPAYHNQARLRTVFALIKTKKSIAKSQRLEILTYE